MQRGTYECTNFQWYWLVSLHILHIFWYLMENCDLNVNISFIISETNPYLFGSLDFYYCYIHVRWDIAVKNFPRDKAFMSYIWATSWENLFMPYADNKSADQPPHPHSLISTFVVHCLDSIIPLASISNISSLHLASVAAYYCCFSSQTREVL